jgi:hypothetical protein
MMHAERETVKQSSQKRSNHKRHIKQARTEGRTEAVEVVGGSGDDADLERLEIDCP